MAEKRVGPVRAVPIRLERGGRIYNAAGMFILQTLQLELAWSATSALEIDHSAIRSLRARPAQRHVREVMAAVPDSDGIPTVRLG